MALYCSQCGVENHQDAATCYHCHSPLARPVYDTGAQGNYGSQFDQGQAYDENKPRFRLGSVVVGAICLLYLLNPTAGFLEFIPDNIPVIGNLDEAAAVTGILMALSNLGVIPYRRT